VARPVAAAAAVYIRCIVPAPRMAANVIRLPTCRSEEAGERQRSGA
jgi:hypothetical protein